MILGSVRQVITSRRVPGVKNRSLDTITGASVRDVKDTIWWLGRKRNVWEERNMSNHSKIPRQVGDVKSAAAVGRTSISARFRV